MRADRFLTLSFFHPLKKILSRSIGIRVPILMYHSISDEPETGHPYFWTNTSPKRFAEHMRLLKEKDYKVISLKDTPEILLSAPINPDNPSDSLPHKYVVVTFDDGFADFQSSAFPILKKYEFSATVFLPTGYISDETSFLKGKKCLRWRDVYELAESGVQFGSHTVTHPKLRDLPLIQVEKELRESKNILEDRLGTEVESFSCPYAFPEADEWFKAQLKIILIDSGYKNSVTTVIGTCTKSDDPLFLRRIPMNSDVDSVYFLAMLDGGYDWMQKIQYGYKYLKK